MNRTTGVVTVVVVMIAILVLVVSSPANKVNARKGHGSCFQQTIADGKINHSIGIHSVYAVARTR